MSLSSLNLDAFHAVARALNFSRAAKELHITQSALTQRVQNLEADLDVTLFVRHPRGVHLTEAGERLLHYCEMREGIESEMLETLTGNRGDGLVGPLRIAGFSTIVRSVLIPALADLLRSAPRLTPHVMTAEMRDLPAMLLRNEVDFIIIDSEMNRGDVETQLLGKETNVLVSSRDFRSPKDVFLDHDVDDPTTVQFFKAQDGPTPKFERKFFDEIYGIIDAVALGLGRAIVPKHLAKRDDRVKVIGGYRTLDIPLYLHYRRRPYYTKLHEAVVSTLITQCRKLL